MKTIVFIVLLLSIYVNAIIPYLITKEVVTRQEGYVEGPCDWQWSSFFPVLSWIRNCPPAIPKKVADLVSQSVKESVTTSVNQALYSTKIHIEQSVNLVMKESLEELNILRSFYFSNFILTFIKQFLM